jgi:spoIIIJ-associated protein
MNQSYIEVEGKTVETAIKIALKKLNLSRNQVEIEILADGEKGLFGMPGGKLAKVRIAPKKVP